MEGVPFLECPGLFISLAYCSVCFTVFKSSNSTKGGPGLPNSPGKQPVMVRRSWASKAQLKWTLEKFLHNSLVRLFIKGFNNSFILPLLPFLNHCDYYEVTFLTTVQEKYCINYRKYLANRNKTYI